MLGRRQTVGLLVAVAVLAGGRLVRQQLLVGPDGAWRRELWLDAWLEPAAAVPADAVPGPASAGADAVGASAMAAADAPGLASAPDPGDAPDAAGGPRAGNPDRRAAGGGKKAGPASPLAINVCPADSLQNLPGIGPVMAERIDATRRRGVIFRNPADLLAIKGIGPATVARLAPWLDFREPVPAAPKLDNPH